MSRRLYKKQHFAPELLVWIRGNTRCYSAVTPLAIRDELHLFASSIDEYGTPNGVISMQGYQIKERARLIVAPERDDPLSSRTLPFVYLASPFSDPDPAVQDARFLAVCTAAAQLHAERIAFAYAPIAHSYSLYKAGNLRGSFEFWSQFDFGMIDRCDEMWICDIPGWDKSHGIGEEIKYAASIDKPVSMLNVTNLLTYSLPLPDSTMEGL